MARPLKDGVDYWNEDCDFYSDKKVRLLRAEFGANGMYMLNYILCEIYKEGYYVTFDKDWCSLVSDGAVCGGSSNFVEELIKGCIRRSFFDKRVFDMFGVITSRGIQKRYIRMLCGRKEIRMIKEYFLLDSDDKNEVPKEIGEKIIFKSVSNTENPVNDINNSVNDVINTQSKVKKSKVKESKEESMSTCVDPQPHFDYQSVIDLFNSICTSLPKVRELTDSRKRAVKSADKKLRGDFESFFKAVEQSDFLTGRNGKWQGCSFDWILKPGNLIKIIEGNYSKRSNEDGKFEQSDKAKNTEPEHKLGIRL